MQKKLLFSNESALKLLSFQPPSKILFLLNFHVFFQPPSKTYLFCFSFQTKFSAPFSLRTNHLSVLWDDGKFLDGSFKVLGCFFKFCSFSRISRIRCSENTRLPLLIIVPDHLTFFLSLILRKQVLEPYFKDLSYI